MEEEASETTVPQFDPFHVDRRAFLTAAIWPHNTLQKTKRGSRSTCIFSFRQAGLTKDKSVVEELDMQQDRHEAESGTQGSENRRSETEERSNRDEDEEHSLIYVVRADVFVEVSKWSPDTFKDLVSDLNNERSITEQALLAGGMYLSKKRSTIRTDPRLTAAIHLATFAEDQHERLDNLEPRGSIYFRAALYDNVAELVAQSIADNGTARGPDRRKWTLRGTLRGDERARYLGTIRDPEYKPDAPLHPLFWQAGGEDIHGPAVLTAISNKRPIGIPTRHRNNTVLQAPGLSRVPQNTILLSTVDRRKLEQEERKLNSAFPVDLRIHSDRYTRGQDAIHSNASDVSIDGTVTGSRRISPAYYVLSPQGVKSGSRSHLNFGVLPPAGKVKGKNPDKITAIVSCRVDGGDYIFQGDLLPAAGYGEPGRDALLDTRVELFTRLVRDPHNLAVLHSACSYGSVSIHSRKPGTKSSPELMASLDIAAVLRTMLVRSGDDDLKECFTAAAAQPSFYETIEPSRNNASLADGKKRPQTSLHNPISALESDAIMAKMIKVLGDSKSGQPVAKWECEQSGQKSVPLSVMALDDLDAEKLDHRHRQRAEKHKEQEYAAGAKAKKRVRTSSDDHESRHHATVATSLGEFDNREFYGRNAQASSSRLSDDIADTNPYSQLYTSPVTDDTPINGMYQDQRLNTTLPHRTGAGSFNYGAFPPGSSLLPQDPSHHVSRFQQPCSGAQYPANTFLPRSAPDTLIAPMNHFGNTSFQHSGGMGLNTTHSHGLPIADTQDLVDGELLPLDEGGFDWENTPW